MHLSGLRNARGLRLPRQPTATGTLSPDVFTRTHKFPYIDTYLKTPLWLLDLMIESQLHLSCLASIRAIYILYQISRRRDRFLADHRGPRRGGGGVVGWWGPLWQPHSGNGEGSPPCPFCPLPLPGPSTHQTLIDGTLVQQPLLRGCQRMSNHAYHITNIHWFTKLVDSPLF